MAKEDVVKDKSYSFSLELIGLVRKFPKNNEGFILGKQLLRCAAAIGANVGEAIGVFTKNDFAYKMSLAFKEARETNCWLRLVRDSNLITVDFEKYLGQSEELRKILTAIVKKSDNE